MVQLIGQFGEAVREKRPRLTLDLVDACTEGQSSPRVARLKAGRWQ